MPSPLFVALYIPVVVWAATGLGLLYAFRRSAPPVVLRLAATFLALWALLATTTLAWVLTRGGWSAIVTLVQHPLLLFRPSAAILWVEGAVGASLVFTVAFLLNQLVGRGFLHLLHPSERPWPPRLPAPRDPTSFLVFPSERPEAFSFTLLELGGRFGVHRREVILMSEGLERRLTVEEVEAVVAHELGHIRGLDSRYLTFLRTLSRMMRWDPLLAYLAYTLTRREEFRADAEAARLTRRPLALARALYKAMSGTPPPFPLGGDAFLGGAGERGRTEALERIRRLVAMEESGAFAEVDGA
ncbi:MAG: M56 family metallopeptidase [Thermoplasmata archaeon]|nr:M56 family metallopeptidase [Thermoplasmata archaeon]MCI4362269.1 M56 family metallopeptidase [Thermoplasmata archaeon]